MLLSIQNNSLFKDLPNPKISMLAIALHFWKSFMCKRLSYCPMSICYRSAWAWAKVQHLFWSYSNSKPTASGCSLVGGESGEMGHSGPAPRLHPCRGLQLLSRQSQHERLRDLCLSTSQHFLPNVTSRFTFETFTQICIRSQSNQLKWSWCYKVRFVCCMMVVGGQQAAAHWAVIMERCNFRRVIIITAGCPR